METGHRIIANIGHGDNNSSKIRVANNEFEEVNNCMIQPASILNNFDGQRLPIGRFEAICRRGPSTNKRYCRIVCVILTYAAMTTKLLVCNIIIMRDHSINYTIILPLLPFISICVATFSL